MRIVKKIALFLICSCVGLVIFIYLYMQQASFGKTPSSSRINSLQSSQNFKNGSFTNLSVTEMLAEGSSYFKILRRTLRKSPNRQPSKELPTVQPDFSNQHDSADVLTWFGHSSYLIQSAGTTVLVDPVFSKRASFAQYIGPTSYPGTMVYDIAAMPSIDYVIITHDHYDHLDYGSILKLKESVKHFYTPLGVGSHLEHWGIERSRITELDWWQSTEILPGMNLTATPARHFSGRGLVRNKTLWASYVFRTGFSSIYIGGDSGYDTHFKMIGERFGPFDLAILENGQYDENWPNIHMMPEETVQASIDLKADVLLPVHWAKFTLAVHDWNEPAIRVTKKSAELNVKITTPKIGEQIIIKHTYPDEPWWIF